MSTGAGLQRKACAYAVINQPVNFFVVFGTQRGGQQTVSTVYQGKTEHLDS